MRSFALSHPLDPRWLDIGPCARGCHLRVCPFAPEFTLALASKSVESCAVRNISTALFCSALLLAATHGSAALLASAPSSTNPQTAEAKAQETVDLKISGMT
jgi:hypothetical protein